MTQSTTSSFVTFKRLLEYVKDKKLGILGGVIGMLGYAAVDATFLYSLKPLLDEGLTGKNPDVLTFMPIFVLVIITARGLAAFMSSYCMAWVGNHVVMKLQRAVFNHLMQMPVAFFDKNSTGDLLSKITYDCNQVANAASNSLVSIFREGAMVVALLAMMFYQSWQLSLIFFVVGPVVGFVINKVSKRFRGLGHQIQAAMGSVTTSSEQMLKGHKEVLMFGGQSLEQEKFANVSNKVRRQNMKMISAQAISVPVIQFLASIALAFVLYLATFPQVMDTLTPGTFTLIISSMFALMKPIKSITQVNNEIQKGLAACDSLFAILDSELEKDTGKKPIARVKGQIAFDKVTFRYQGKEKPALDNISFTVEAGKSIALVGRSGSGKSTIASIITRFYDGIEGDVSIDGQSIYDFPLDNLRSQMAYVSQKVHLFDDTIANNIAYATGDNYSREQIIAAATTAHAMEFIEQFPDGLDTLVGEDGVMLSGGQRQRIAIARALLRDAPILILDEATSALDTESERHIQSALEALQKDRTSIVIAHRLSTIENADQILVIDQGRIIEQGTHQFLSEHDGVYASLVKMQTAAS
ncbi:lipid A ABC transporter ATP-binding protein/permease MsbA [Motilimonas sp. 1_MG-2023]|uniref:lipid A ABC transporter ATP-binding protein/permease MsbA n=1 Tax=Motilimonas sp. 1_MG-2023 TaxID=3062672 RepID=UPI0026E495D6|nr:lipid A ABC transporter ATP-binding protein/permease MsbA [Motilimonas sp. 1_MG-2023]MDO6524714.1 lipid A ABC transporter ATP-binding protein/permease MsbA [Motilimonas sp. 1_MG-2023]